MKKLVYFVAIILVAVLALGLCGCTKSNQITRYYGKLQRAKGVTAEISVTVPLLGETKIVMQKEGKKTHTTAITLLGLPETYTEAKGNTVDVYNKTLQGAWTKTVVEADSDSIVSLDDYKKFFSASDYTYDEEADEYIMKDNIKYEILKGVEASKIVLSFSGDNCNARGKVSYNGITMPFTLVVKNLNKTQVTLPIVS